MSLMTRVLVAHNDVKLAERLAIFLVAQNMKVDVAVLESTMMDVARNTHPDMIVLGRRPSTAHLLRLCSGLRTSGFDGGLVLMSDDSSEDAIVAGLGAGADDFVSTACSLAELLARLRCLSRRIERAYAHAGQKEPAPSRISFDEFEVTYDGTKILGRGREYQVLAVLMKKRGKVVTQKRLIEQVWGPDWTGSNKALHMAVSRIRVRLDAVRASERIETVRGVGFRLE